MIDLLRVRMAAPLSDSPGVPDTGDRVGDDGGENSQWALCRWAKVVLQETEDTRLSQLTSGRDARRSDAGRIIDASTTGSVISAARPSTAGLGPSSPAGAHRPPAARRRGHQSPDAVRKHLSVRHVLLSGCCKSTGYLHRRDHLRWVSHVQLMISTCRLSAVVVEMSAVVLE